MLTILYTIVLFLNICIAIALIYLYFVAIKLIKTHKGGMMATLFFIGSISIINPSTTSNEKDDLTWEHPNRVRTETQIKTSTITLQNNGISAYNLYVHYGVDTITHQSIPNFASASTSGFISGIEWEPTNISIKNITGRSFNYTVTGQVKWKLFKFNIFTEEKIFNGTYSY